MSARVEAKSDYAGHCGLNLPPVRGILGAMEPQIQLR